MSESIFNFLRISRAIFKVGSFFPERYSLMREGETFSSYSVCPGTDQYVIGAPYLPYMKIKLENGKTFVIKADKVSNKNRYIK